MAAMLIHIELVIVFIWFNWSPVMANTKKLLYQLEQDYSCEFSKVFKPEECARFDEEVGKEGKTLSDTDGREILTLKAPCTIIVHRGYRWDGCSPKFNFLWLDLFWVGTPDGLMIGSERPRQGPDEAKHIPITHERVTHLASVVHDVLGYCKNKAEMPELFKAVDRDLWFSPSRRRRDLLFLELLKRKNHTLRWIYYLATVLLGPFYDLILGKSPNEK